MSREGITCIDCKEWFVMSGCGGYSEMTPGWDFSMECSKKHWELDPMEDEDYILRGYLKMAETCKDFTQRAEKS